MNKKEILLVTALSLGLFSVKAADEVIFEDATFLRMVGMISKILETDGRFDLVILGN